MLSPKRGRSKAIKDDRDSDETESSKDDDDDEVCCPLLFGHLTFFALVLFLVYLACFVSMYLLPLSFYIFLMTKFVRVRTRRGLQMPKRALTMRTMMTMATMMMAMMMPRDKRA